MATTPLTRLQDAPAPGAGTDRKRLLVIVNPYATTVSAHLSQLVVSALRGAYDVEAVHTTAPNHATQLCREAAHEGLDLVVAFGGDGTVNEVANGLVGTDTPFTCLPGGSNSVFCRMLGIPADIVDATEHLLALSDHWTPTPIDVAHVNGRHFLFSSGIGLDAAVVARVDGNPKMKARFRQSYFAWSAAATFARRYIVNPPTLQLRLADGTVQDGATVIVQNGDPYTYFHGKPVEIAKGATLDSGNLAGVVLRSTGPTMIGGMATRLLSDRWAVADHKGVDSFTAIEPFTVVSTDGREVAIHVDGDHVDDVTEATYGVRPGALSVLA
jgi:diacylglycerol kinase family enzyme